MFKKKHIKSDVFFKITGLSTVKLTDCNSGLFSIIHKKEPSSQPIEIFGSKIKPVKWWEFWRYYLIAKRKKELKVAHNKFISIFGNPYYETINT